MTADASLPRHSEERARPARLLRRLRRPSLLLLLSALALVVLVPALLFSAFLILQFSRQQDELALARVRGAAEAISASVDRELVGLITAGRILATSPFIDTRDFAAFHDRTSTALAGTGAQAEVVDRDFHVLLNTRTSLLSLPPSPAYRQATTDAMETGRPQVSGVLYVEALRAFTVYVAVPVVRGGTVSEVLLVYKRAEDLRAGLEEGTVPPAWSVVIRDRTGKRIDAAVTDKRAGAAPSDPPQDRPSLAETVGLKERNDRIEATHVSFLSGWTTSVAVPQAVVDQPAVRSWMTFAVVGCFLFLFSSALTVFFGRRLAAPILALAQQARLIGRGEPANPIGTAVEEIADVSRVLARASRERREAEEQNRLLMREMVHRAKNQYALIAAISRRAARESTTTVELQKTLADALDSLARSSDLLAAEGWDGVPLAALAERQLSAFGAGRDERISIHGPDLRLNASAAQTVGLALHELATNAAKYGALSVEAGRVAVEWATDASFVMRWEESGGPLVTPPKRSGFGSLIIRTMTARGLSGSVDMRFAEAGVLWTLTAPLDAVTAAP